MVLEIRPTINWDKGKALEFLLHHCVDVCPVYIGDDRTDEDAFKVLRERGQGFGILVSPIPRDTAASYSLQDPSELKKNSDVVNFGEEESKTEKLEAFVAAVNNNDSSHFVRLAIAYVEGAEATMNVWDPFIQQTNEFSSSQVWLSGGTSFASDLNGWLGIERSGYQSIRLALLSGNAPKFDEFLQNSAQFSRKFVHISVALHLIEG
ncbi:hypothetical protein L1987_57741 [Smallanthus sonchifolius]|uniref:Uncharacterized protein n=1 Tax=Smallanthus sonchifolius TaxID=185202 RepID=A0ACB9DDJ7_9ASTR|nr:hypothetical protein L1987_57741 [Smallanthus sonchifolius]